MGSGRCATVSEGERKDGDGSAMAQRARWLEAKSQLLYLIESLPFLVKQSGSLTSATFVMPAD